MTTTSIENKMNFWFRKPSKRSYYQEEWNVECSEFMANTRDALKRYRTIGTLTTNVE